MKLTFLPSFLAICLFIAPVAQAIELTGLVSDNFGTVVTKPLHFTSNSGGVGYAFLGRFELGPGKVETGFFYAPVTINTHESFGDIKIAGSYWMFPVLYRVPIYDPFVSIAVGFDYAVVGNNTLTAGGGVLNGISSNYQNHFGAQVSLELTQDVGENMSIVLDGRYRRGLANGVAVTNTDQTVTNSKYNLIIVALGIQKRLEP